LKGKDQGSNSLRTLLDSICLRRTKKLLNLPDSFDEDRRIEFTPVEKKFYKETQAEMIATVKQHDSQARNKKDFFGMFQLQLQLRRLCNHGTFQKALCTSPAEDIQFDPEQAFELLQEKKMTKCTYCNVLVGGIKGIEDKRSGSFSVCGHLFCSGCVPKYEAAFRSVPDTGRQCPLCMRKVSENCIIHYGHHMEGVRTILSSTLFPLDGNSISSKVTALINDLKANANEGKRLVHYTFYKVKCLLLPSIVFSCWTRSLDLVAQHLSLQQTKYARIDGTYSLSQRQQVLGDYHTDTATRILLMTTGTGAVGYELPRVALF
jgi:SWI/SNF-related matrix-associated actin-dependent regulator of chromatin subfamily A3